MSIVTTKPGKFGTLHHYTIEYTDKAAPGFGIAKWTVWAYDMGHAVDKFDDRGDGFMALRIARTVYSESGSELTHRMKWHAI